MGDRLGTLRATCYLALRHMEELTAGGKQMGLDEKSVGGQDGRVAALPPLIFKHFT